MRAHQAQELRPHKTQIPFLSPRLLRKVFVRKHYHYWTPAKLCWFERFDRNAMFIGFRRGSAGVVYQPTNAPLLDRVVDPHLTSSPLLVLTSPLSLARSSVALYSVHLTIREQDATVSSRRIALRFV